MLSVAVLLFASGTAIAQQATSPAYGVDEVFFGTGGDLGDCSGTGPNAGNPYCAKVSTGELAQGFAADSSNGNGAQVGNNTNREEYLEFIVNGTSTDLGVLTPASAATTTGTFSVKNYLSTGYVILNASNPPRAGTSGHSITNLTSPTAYNAGQEQFGINLVTNTTSGPCNAPANVGADPVQVPDPSFSYGSAASGYNTCGLFKYVKGDTIAQSTRSTGQTNYTVSYMYHILDSTPAGVYTFNHDLVAFATY